MPGTARPAPITPQNPAGSGYAKCTLTYYDPALGGINSSGGVANPHAATASGEPYDKGKYTCAAPPSFPFGTHLEIRANGKAVIVKVNDRGGAIQTVGGIPHFDLSVIANDTLGKPASGMYKITSAPVGNNPRGWGAKAAVDVANAVTGPFQSVADALSFIFSMQFLYVVGGGALLLAALFILARKVT